MTRTLIALGLSLTVMTATPAQAAEFRDYSQGELAAAQKQGRPVLISVKAWWCPVCASQNRTIKKEVAAADYARLLVLELNYDKQKAEWRALGVRKQATLIGYRGRQEVGRIEFKTNKDLIRDLLRRTIS